MTSGGAGGGPPRRTTLEFAHEELRRRLAEAARSPERFGQGELQRLLLEAEEALATVARRFGILVEHSSDAVALLGPDGVILDVSPATPRILGWDLDDLRGRNVGEFVHADDQPALDQRLAQSVERPGEQVSALVRLRHRTGRWLWLEAVLTNLVHDATVGAIVVNYRDVTARQVGLETVRVSERRFRGLVEHSLDGVCLVDGRGRAVYSSPSVTRILGYAVDDFVGRSALDLVHPDDRRAMEIAFAGSLRQPGAMAAGEARVRRQDGTWRLLEGSASNHLAEPAIGAVVVNYHDITERRRSDEEARLYADVVRNIHMGLQVWQLKDRDDPRSFELVAANPAAGAVLHAEGGPPAEVMDEGMAERYRQVVLTGEPLDLGEVTRPGAKDQVLAVKVFSLPADCVGVAFEDATARTRLEAQLQQAQRMDAVGRLAGGVAHDFNNLLTAIMGFADLALRRVPPDEPAHRQVSEIRKAADRAAGLTRQLLTFSRRHLVETRVLDLNGVTREIEAMLRRVIGEHVQLVTVLDDALWPVRADPGQIEQVLVNLAVNARDAMPGGGVLVIETANVELDAAYAEAHVGARAGPHVMLSVTDSGQGMDEETLTHLFEPFFTTKDEGQGTGLGLATVYGIVSQAGGHVNVYSEPGLGAAFRVYLPKTEEPAEAGRAVEAAAPKEVPTGHETVLLVEDDDALRSLSHELLESLGYDVITAARGPEALRLAERHPGPIHLLLTDVVMPEVSGPELAKSLLAVRPGVRVLFMSGYTGDAALHLGMLERSAALLQKPFTFDALAGRVREVLGSPAPA